ncbi:hypothetical protein [Terricaulis sp.]|uniref:hypothetical protein n=1 Tax=Terricaulis sp. TaxID=2768686 RepID=UPI0037834852
MRALTIATLIVALAACSPASNRPAAQDSDAVTTLPTGFPSADSAQRGAECAAYLGLAVQANATPAGRDGPIMQQAADQWRAALQIDGGMSEEEVQQLVGSTVNTLLATPTAQRDAAAAWCVENAPEPDPDH